MATNQRENARKEKKQKKDRKIKAIIWSILIIVMIAMLGMKLAEVDYSGLGNKIFGNITSKATGQSSTIMLDSSRNVKIAQVNGKLNALTDTSYTVYNPGDSSIQYSYIHGYANPCMAYAGNYTCLYDQGGARIRLDSNSGAVYESRLDNSILCADVANNGNIIYATNGENSKSTIVLVNKSLKKLLQLDVSEGFVTSVAVDSSGKKCAYAVVNSKNADLVTTVYTINAGDEEPIASFEFVSSPVVDLSYSSSSLFVVCQNNVTVVKNQKKAQTVFESNNIVAVNYTYTDKNQLVFVYADYAQATENKVAYITSNGKIKNTFNLDQRVKYIHSSSNEFTVLFDDKISVYSLSKGDEKSSVNCDDSVNSVIKMSSTIYVQHQQIIDALNA